MSKHFSARKTLFCSKSNVTASVKIETMEVEELICYNVKMNCCDLKNWPIFAALVPEFTSTLRMVFVYGCMGDNALVVTKDKKTYALGSEANKYFGTDGTSDTLDPFEIEELNGEDIKSFAYGQYHVLALTKQGLVYSWVYEPLDKPQDGPFVKLFMKDCLSKNIIDIACGNHHSVALTKEGKVYLWGSIRGKKLGFILEQMGPDNMNKNIVSISCGRNFGMAVTDMGEVYGWGSNRSGQLGSSGLHANTFKNLYKVPLTCVKIVKVACGGDHTLALSASGDLCAWGRNDYGQLGVGCSTFYEDTPKQLYMDEVKDVAASYCNDISVAVGENYDVFIWGACLGQKIRYPKRTPLKCMHDAFPLYASVPTMDRPLILYDEEPELGLIDSFRNAFNDPATSDLIIKVQGKSIYVHRIVLTIRCHYLKKKFQEDWDKNNKDVIEIEEYAYRIYYSFLEYLYTNEVNLHLRDVIKLYSLANAYSEDELKNLCIWKINKGITVQNAAFLHMEALRYKHKEIEELCFNFMKDHFTMFKNFN